MLIEQHCISEFTSNSYIQSEDLASSATLMRREVYTKPLITPSASPPWKLSGISTPIKPNMVCQRLPR